MKDVICFDNKTGTLLLLNELYLPWAAWPLAECRNRAEIWAEPSAGKLSFWSPSTSFIRQWPLLCGDLSMTRAGRAASPSPLQGARPPVRLPGSHCCLSTGYHWMTEAPALTPWPCSSLSHLVLSGYSRGKTARRVQRRSQFWTPCRTLWLAFHCFCSYDHTEWPASENPAPLPDC